jgi:hypothetical protein
LLTLWVADRVVCRLGGGGFARLVASLCIAIAPHFLFVFHVLSMNGPEVFLWTLGALAALVAVEDRKPWAWIVFGLACGVGLLNKHSMLVFGLGIGVGLLASPARRELTRPWIWVAAAIAAVLFAPHVVWQAEHGWPTVEFIRNAQARKIAPLSPVEFVASVAGMMNPFTLPVWVAGMLSLLLTRDRPRLRVLGWCAVVALGVFITQQSKAYYVTPVFPLLFAAGAVAVERWTLRFSRARTVIPVLLVAGGIVAAPFALPVLSVNRFIAYAARLGASAPSGERQELGPLPQHFADMFGWEELAREISRVYLSLPEPERPTARVFARNYGEAGALEYYAKHYPLPRGVCPHNNYWYWGPGPDDGGTIIVIGGTREDHLEALSEVTLAGRTACEYCMPYENGRPIFVGKGWRVSLNAIWPRERVFI